ncbi:MAG: hypothetical protein AUI36_14530 [Cyanobacteria bacterium 13_1_40CM_2_61_4]|nr:MAG: hypothetical protein AUI36_14530 [Cyanobacteria bacterium 13_1_40CM_2_61_4]
MQEIEELKRQGLSIKAISNLTGCDRKTIRKYLARAGNDSAMDLASHGRETGPIQNVPSRKTDVKDCQWLAELLRHGLIPRQLHSAAADS